MTESYYAYVWIAIKLVRYLDLVFLIGPVYCLRDVQIFEYINDENCIITFGW